MAARRNGRGGLLAAALLLLVAGGAACLAVRGGGPAPLVFIQLSDLHLPAQACAECTDEPRRRLEEAVAEINAMHPPPRFVIVTGDIAAVQGEEGSYRRFRELTAALKAPIYYAMGNHDRRGVFRECLLGEEGSDGSPYYYSFDLDSYHFAVLDSVSPGRLEGMLDQAQLDWLENDLSRNKGRLTVVFLHHNSREVGLPQEYPLLNAGRFLELLSRFPDVRAVCSGHVHFSSILFDKGKYLASSMALSFGHIPNAGPPGYRIVTIEPSGAVRFLDKRLGREAIEEHPAP